jgi:hypothetical protein
MKNKYQGLNILLIISISILIIVGSFTGCKKSENPIKFTQGTFPDSVINLNDINSVYDDYNLDIPQIYGNLPIVFSSNRNSSGGQFDLEQAIVTFTFDQISGAFGLGTEMSDDSFLNKLLNAANTTKNDFGPYRLWSSLDGYEYLITSSENDAGNLDLFFFKNRPVSGSSLPDIDGPHPASLLNTDFDDAYICFNGNLDSAYFISNQSGNFDIYISTRPAETEISSWLSSDYEASAEADSINSAENEKCPMVIKNVMIFSSDRPGGLGGLDLYYSVFKNGNWNSPVNMGPGINSADDEYRPVIGYHPDFTNYFMMFSSNRSGGKGGFDLYLTGIELPE